MSGNLPELALRTQSVIRPVDRQLMLLSFFAIWSANREYGLNTRRPCLTNTVRGGAAARASIFLAPRFPQLVADHRAVTHWRRWRPFHGTREEGERVVVEHGTRFRTGRQQQDQARNLHEDGFSRCRPGHGS